MLVGATPTSTASTPTPPEINPSTIASATCSLLPNIDA